jgi:RimJ/RimL family protein N-acetyltransferase
MPAVKLLETDRLLLRALRAADAPFLVELLNTPAWLQYIGDRNVHNQEQALAYLRNGPHKSYSEHGFGLMLVELRAGRQPVGLCGLLKRDYLSFPDIGFALLPAFEGKGLAHEAAQAVLEEAAHQGIKEVGAITLPHNTRSVRLLQKLGLSFRELIQVPPKGEELALYATRLR